MIDADQRRLVFDPIGMDAWRLCDADRDTHDPDYVVAYVERREDGVYEAVWMGAGSGTSRHRSLDDVLARSVDVAEREVPPSRTKPVPIPAVRPMRGSRRR